MKTKKRSHTGLILLACVLLAAAAVIVARNWDDWTFSMREHTDAELRVKAYADEIGVPYSAYPDSLIALLERNPETEAFVLGYPLRQEEQIDLSAYDLSVGVPLFMQWDTRWGYLKYGSDVVGITGCGPVCLAMAGYYVTGDDAFSPDKMVKFAADNGYYSRGNGSSWTLISEGGVKLGLDVTEIPLVKKRITDNLAAGNPVICAMGPGDFTTSGHYIVLTGLQDGLFTVNDPNSHENSERLWSYEEIEGQIRNLWVIRA